LAKLRDSARRFGPTITLVIAVVGSVGSGVAYLDNKIEHARRKIGWPCPWTWAVVYEVTIRLCWRTAMPFRPCGLLLALLLIAQCVPLAVVQC